MAMIRTNNPQSRSVPASFYEMDFVRSYSREDDDGNLWRVEVRKHPITGQSVQVKTPVPVDTTRRPR